MKKLNALILITLVCLFGISSAHAQGDPSADRWFNEPFTNLQSIVTGSLSGGIGINVSTPLAGTKLDVRDGNIFHSPFTSNPPKQFIDIGESSGQCDIYGMRVQKPKTTIASNENYTEAFVNLGIKTTTEGGTFQVKKITPLLSYNPYFAIEYDNDPNGCPVRIATFNGNKATYQLTVNGVVSVTKLIETSDERLKKDFNEIVDARSMINQMHPVSYVWNRNAAPDKNLQDERMVGFKAQELRAVLPEAVSEGEDGYLGINYSAVIPVLVAALQEQNQEIASLREELQMVKSNRPALDENSAPEHIELFQNQPNPFNSETSIRLSLPQNVQNATLYIYDMNGKQIKELTLEERGQVSARIDGGELGAGMYIYALVADGKAVDSKRMILTR